VTTFSSYKLTLVALGFAIVFSIYSMEKGNRMPKIKSIDLTLKHWPQEEKGFRCVLLKTGTDISGILSVSLAVSIVLFFSGAYYFRKMEKDFADLI